jgi:hypothetical protein
MPVQPHTPTGVASAYVDTGRLGIEGHSLLTTAGAVKPRSGAPAYSSMTGATTTP